jgi:hypothetical protein
MLLSYDVTWREERMWISECKGGDNNYYISGNLACFEILCLHISAAVMFGTMGR